MSSLPNDPAASARPDVRATQSFPDHYEEALIALNKKKQAHDGRAAATDRE